jgi:hypothetical protein
MSNKPETTLPEGIKVDENGKFYVEMKTVVHGQEVSVRRYGNTSKRPKQYVRCKG